MVASLANDPNLQDVIISVEPNTCQGQSECPLPEASNISFSTSYFGTGWWWITSASYNGSMSGVTWEWEVLTNTMYGQTNPTSGVLWWQNPGSGIDIRIRVTNECGETSAWRNEHITTN